MACGPLAPLPPDWSGMAQGYETLKTLGVPIFPETPLPSGLPPVAAGLESSSPSQPRAGSPPGGGVRRQRDQLSALTCPHSLYTLG